MSAPGQTAPRRIGLLGNSAEPVAQLLQDAYPPGAADLLPIEASDTDLALVDEIVVLDHDVALAHLRALRSCPKPVRVVVRRRGPSVEALAWRSGMTWFRKCLDEAGIDHIGLSALTEDAAAALSEELGREVSALAPLSPIGTARPVTPLRRDAEEVTFYLDGPDGRREARRATLEVYNWARLRRLGRLRAADPDDEDLADLVAYANGPDTADMPGAAGPDRLCVLAVIPNGTGLGHLTRMLAIACALQETAQARVIFWSFSRAAQIIEEAGFEVILRQTAPHLRAHPPDWRLWETLEFARAIKALGPQVVIYDGGTFDPFMIDALRLPGCGHCGVAWVRRGMLQPETDAQMLESEQYCDLVLEPGDLAVEEDKGPTRTRTAQYKGYSRFLFTPPVTLKPFLPAYSRRDSKRRLKLGWGRHCLVSLGGAFGDWDAFVQNILDIAARRNVKLVWARSPLAPAPASDGINRIVRQFFPLSRYMSAFDGVITATGYNSYHELMLGYRGPILFAPTNNDRLDDQVSRARYAADRGWASIVEVDSPADQSDVIDAFMQQVRAGATVEGRPTELYGASAMAEAIADVAARYAGRPPA